MKKVTSDCLNCGKEFQAKYKVGRNVTKTGSQPEIEPYCVPCRRKNSSWMRQHIFDGESFSDSREREVPFSSALHTRLTVGFKLLRANGKD